MFLSRMVNGILNTNKNVSCSNPNDQAVQHFAGSASNSDPPSCHKTAMNKSKKKSEKSKRNDSKRSITKLFKSSAKDPSEERQQPSTSKRVVSCNDSNSKALSSTKVKSGSWKRSEKSNTVLNVLNNKKSKGLRKNSPNLLAFSTRPIKMDERHTTNSTENNSVCRPGTLYSDVLFSANPSNLIKVKILTPRRNVGEAAQKKLTKALRKYSASEKNDPTTDESEIEWNPNVFPSLTQLSQTKTGDSVSTLTSSPPTPCSSSGNTINSLDVSSNSESVPSNNKSDFYEEPDVVILPECSNGPDVGSRPVTYGNYLKQQNQGNNMNGDSLPSISEQSHTHLQSKPRFRIDIPSWNFTEVDVGNEGFPKLLYQFDDENYLKATKAALLSMNSALEGKYGTEDCPKFLQQFEDENYLKAEKSATLGLNLILGNIPQQGMSPD